LTSREEEREGLFEVSASLGGKGGRKMGSESRQPEKRKREVLSGGETGVYNSLEEARPVKCVLVPGRSLLRDRPPGRKIALFERGGGRGQ